MRTEFWHDIKNAFVGLSGRVLVTTAIHSVANTCSSSAAHDHVYAMKTLADEHSRLLFFKEAFQDDNPPVDKEDQLGSEALKKCDGLPLALVTTARYLQSTGNPTHGNWATLCHNLGAHLSKPTCWSTAMGEVSDRKSAATAGQELPQAASETSMFLPDTGFSHVAGMPLLVRHPALS
uniref:Uncharacterized protein n=1 Tax=Aegilops tauschii subsp. strangulata TaxID=200361 RepID=A0A453QCN5_AEGTS